MEKDRNQLARERANRYYYENKEECRAANEEWKKNNREKMREYNRDYRQRNKEKIAEKNKKWAQENKERMKELQKEARKRNPEKYRDTINKWNERNRGKVRQRDAAYKAKKKAGTLSLDGLKEELELFYGNCPEGYEVDHIIPIVHTDVCGLHVPWNLQYLPKIENRSKGNRLCLE